MAIWKSNCPVEIAIHEELDSKLCHEGLMPLVYCKNTDYSIFFTSQSLHIPTKYSDSSIMESLQRGASLAYLFPACRFGHYVKYMIQDKIASFIDRSDLEKWLTNWISQYITTDPEASDITKARCPLASAKIAIQKVENKSNQYVANLYLQPHYQLEKLSHWLVLRIKLPNTNILSNR